MYAWRVIIYNLLLLSHALRNWKAHSTSPPSLGVIVQTSAKCLLTAFARQPWKPEFIDGTTHSISILFSPAHELWEPFFICFTLSNPDDEYRMINYFKVLSMSDYKYFRNISTFSFKTLLAADGYDDTPTLLIQTRKAGWLWPKTSTNFTCEKATFLKAKVPVRFCDLISPGVLQVLVLLESAQDHWTPALSRSHVAAASFSAPPYHKPLQFWLRKWRIHCSYTWQVMESSASFCFSWNYACQPLSDSDL